MVYYDNQFYAITHDGALVSFGTSHPFKYNVKLTSTKTSRYSKKGHFCFKRYLVESCKVELLQVKMYKESLGDRDRVTKKFIVFKFDFEKTRWLKMESLGDIALFLGHNTSI